MRQLNYWLRVAVNRPGRTFLEFRGLRGFIPQFRVKEEEAPNLKKLARLYSTMSIEGASAILRELDDAVVVKVMSFMKEDQSAPLLEAMAREGETQAKRAANIAEALRKTVADKKKTP